MLKICTRTQTNLHCNYPWLPQRTKSVYKSVLSKAWGQCGVHTKARLVLLNSRDWRFLSPFYGMPQPESTQSLLHRCVRGRTYEETYWDRLSKDSTAAFNLPTKFTWFSIAVLCSKLKNIKTLNHRRVLRLEMLRLFFYFLFYFSKFPFVLLFTDVCADDGVTYVARRFHPHILTYKRKKESMQRLTLHTMANHTQRIDDLTAEAVINVFRVTADPVECVFCYLYVRAA